MLAEHENKIIGMIYDAALNPMLWQEVLSEIADFTKSTTAIFTATDQLSPNYDFVFTHSIPIERVQTDHEAKGTVVEVRLTAR